MFRNFAIPILSLFLLILHNSFINPNKTADRPKNQALEYEDATSITLVNVHVVDIEKRRILKNKDIVIEGKTIKKIFTHQSGRLYDTDRIIEGNESYAVPSICDMHHHLTPSDFDFSGVTPKRQHEILQEQKFYGIQAILNPNISLEAARFISAQRGDTDLPYAEMTGPSIGPENGWGSHQVKNKEGITRIIDELKEMGVRSVKFTYDDMSWLGGQMPVLDPGLLKYIIDYSHSKNMLAIAHVPDLSKAKQLLKFGLDGLVHGIISEKVDDEFLALLKRNNAIYIPTMAVYKTSFNFQESVRDQFKYDIWDRYPQNVQDSLSNDASGKMWNSWWPRAGSLRSSLANLYWNTQAVYKSGNLVMMGSDTGTPGVLPGISAYYEMELMEQSGLRPYEVLECATLNPLKFLDLYPAQGKIEQGAEANMILLKNDPTLTVKNIGSSWLVIHRGVVVSER